MLFAFAALAISAMQPVVAASEGRASASVTFAELRNLVGDWRPEDAASPLRVRFYLTAKDSVLVESWEVRGRSHSLTLYHLDGASMLATHYCPQGNQPRLELSGRTSQGYYFAFRDSTNLPDAAKSHQHDLWIDASNAGRLVRTETYRENGSGSPETTIFVRAPATN